MTSTARERALLDLDATALLELDPAGAMAHPRARDGLFGPDSASWRLNREAGLLLGGARALLLQIAHPAVAAAVEQHSDFRRDPLGRGRRTFAAVYEVVFADLPTALAAARAVRTRHETVTGTIADGPHAGRRYRALDPELLLWVHATLVDTALLVDEVLLGSLDEAGHERYYEESKRMAWVFGVPASVVPSSLAEFRRYMDEHLHGDALTVGQLAASEARHLFAQPPAASLAAALGRGVGPFLSRIVDGTVGQRAAAALVRRLTALWLPTSLRRSFALPDSTPDLAAARVALLALRSGYRRLPSAIRHHAGWRCAMARAAA